MREYETGGCRYSAGAIDGESTCFDGFPHSALDRVIVQDALLKAELDGSVLHDESGRLWDVVFMACHAVKTACTDGSELRFELARVPRDGRATTAAVTLLKLLVGPGDHGEPVVTIVTCRQTLSVRPEVAGTWCLA